MHANFTTLSLIGMDNTFEIYNTLDLLVRELVRARALTFLPAFNAFDPGNDCDLATFDRTMPANWLFKSSTLSLSCDVNAISLNCILQLVITAPRAPIWIGEKNKCLASAVATENVVFLSAVVNYSSNKEELLVTSNDICCYHSNCCSKYSKIMSVRIWKGGPPGGVTRWPDEHEEHYKHAR